MSLKPVDISCTIGGRSYQIANSSVSTGINEHMSMSFSIDVDANPLSVVPQIGELVIMTQVCDGTQTFQALITDLARERGNNYTRWRVSAKGLSVIGNYTRLYEELGPETGSILLSSQWGGAFSDRGLTVTMDVTPGAPVVEEYASIYGSLMDLTNYVVQTTGWAWTLESDVFSFFDPLSNTAGDVIQGDFASGSLQVTESDSSLYNVARQQAYEYMEVDFTRPADETIDRTAIGLVTIAWHYRCTRVFYRPRTAPFGALKGWEFVDAELISGRPYGMTLAEAKLAAQWTYRDDEEALESDVPFYNIVSTIRATFRRLVWVEGEDSTSRAIYGAREAPVLSNDGGIGIDEALRKVESYLEQRSVPSRELSGEYLYSDIFAGEVRRFELPDLGIDQDFLVESVVRTTSGDDLQISITGRSVTGANRLATPRQDALPEVFRRIELLENAAMHPSSEVGKISQGTGPITAGYGFTGTMEISELWEYEEINYGISIEEGI